MRGEQRRYIWIKMIDTLKEKIKSFPYYIWSVTIPLVNMYYT